MEGKIRIDTHGSPTARGWTIYLDDMDITRYVRHINIDVGPKTTIPQIQIDFIASLDMPSEIYGVINAHEYKPLEKEAEDA